MMTDIHSPEELHRYSYECAKPVYITRLAILLIATAAATFFSLVPILGGLLSMDIIKASDYAFEDLPKNAEVYIENATFYGRYPDISKDPNAGGLFGNYYLRDCDHLLFSFKDKNGEDVYSSISIWELRGKSYDLAYEHFCENESKDPITLSMCLSYYGRVGGYASELYSEYMPDGSDHVLNARMSYKFDSLNQYYGAELCLAIPILVIALMLLYYAARGLVRSYIGYKQVVECLSENRMLATNAKNGKMLLLENEKKRNYSKILIPLLWAAYVVLAVVLFGLIGGYAIAIILFLALPITVYTFMFFTRIKRLHKSYKNLVELGEENLAEDIYITPLGNCGRLPGFHFGRSAFLHFNKGILAKYSEIENIYVDFRQPRLSLSSGSILKVLLTIIFACFGYAFIFKRKQTPHIIMDVTGYKGLVLFEDNPENVIFVNKAFHLLENKEK